MEDPGALATGIELLLRRLTSGEPQLPARLGLPDGGHSVAAELTVWPLALLPEQNMAAGQSRGPLRLRVRALVSAQGPLPAVIGLLDDVLAREAAEHHAWLVAEQAPPGLWRDLGVAPRLGLLFDVPVQVARAQARTPRVRSLARIQAVALRSVAGRLVGPGNVPLAGMRVTSPDAAGSATTDPQGRFTLPVAAADRPVRLRLSGRGLSFTAQIPHQDPADGTSAGSAADETIVITCDIEEAQ
jgi:hypothetical protein